MEQIAVKVSNFIIIIIASKYFLTIETNKTL